MDKTTPVIQLVDDADSAIVGQLTWYEDQDNDSMGSSVTPLVSFTAKWLMAVTGDCDDSNAVIYDT